jgi:hypothetical protein
MDKVNRTTLRLSAFLSFTYFEEGDPAIAAGYFQGQYRQDANSHPALTIASQMRALLKAAECVSVHQTTGRKAERYALLRSTQFGATVIAQAGISR